MFFTAVLAHRVAFFGYVILLFAFLGLLINLGSIALLFHKNRPSLFHHLLKILAVVDCLVLVCCLVSYGIPDIVPGYLERHHPTVSLGTSLLIVHFIDRHGSYYISSHPDRWRP